MGTTTWKRTFGPIALSANFNTNVYNNASGLLYDVIRQIHVVNKTGAPASFNLCIGSTGSTAAGTEIFFQQNVNADATFDWYGALKLVTGDFLVGGASAAATLTITGLGEQYVV